MTYLASGVTPSLIQTKERKASPLESKGKSITSPLDFRVLRFAMNVLGILKGKLKYLYNHMTSQTFSQGVVLATAGNHAKWESAWDLSREHQDERFASIAAKKGLIVAPIAPIIQIRGVCYSACRIFARDYLYRQNIIKVAKQFEGGAPQEAVILHNRYLGLSQAVIRGDKNGLNRKKSEITAEAVGLRIECIFYLRPGGDVPTETYFLGASQDLFKEKGVFSLSFISLEKERGHAILFIKRDEKAYLFDINENTRGKMTIVNLALVFKYYNVNPQKGIRVEKLTKI